MTVTNVVKDTEALTMQVTAEFDADVDRVWQLWADPRKLERWWGPPTYPATVVDHDLTPGGRVSYYMTGPDGDRSAGWWRVVAVDAPSSLEVEDGFADDSGKPNPDMPTMTMRFTLSSRDGGGTRVQIVTQFPSRDQMDQLLQMGMDEGMRAAMGQMDAVLAEV
jgi:uncharacterized protein YndB with AHSA1/START domain